MWLAATAFNLCLSSCLSFSSESEPCKNHVSVYILWLGFIKFQLHPIKSLRIAELKSDAGATSPPLRNNFKSWYCGTRLRSFLCNGLGFVAVNGVYLSVWSYYVSFEWFLGWNVMRIHTNNHNFASCDGQKIKSKLLQMKHRQFWHLPKQRTKIFILLLAACIEAAKKGLYVNYVRGCTGGWLRPFFFGLI